MVLDGTFLPSGDEDHLFDPCRSHLFHDILDGGFIDNGQQFFWNHLGGREKSCSETGCRDDRFFYLHKSPRSLRIVVFNSVRSAHLTT